jgi:hypothetical protein
MRLLIWGLIWDLIYRRESFLPSVVLCLASAICCGKSDKSADIYGCAPLRVDSMELADNVGQEGGLMEVDDLPLAFGNVNGDAAGMLVNDVRMDYQGGAGADLQEGQVSLL